MATALSKQHLIAGACVQATDTIVSHGQTTFSWHGAYRLHYKCLLEKGSTYNAIDKHYAEKKWSGHARLAGTILSFDVACMGSPVTILLQKSKQTSLRKNFKFD